MTDMVENCTIMSGYRSDHSIVQLKLIFTKFNVGKGIWKINNSLLSNKDYLNLINKIIIEEKLNYAVPVYSIDYIKNSDINENIQFVVDDDDFLELLYLRIRGESLKFASIKKTNRYTRKKPKITLSLWNQIPFQINSFWMIKQELEKLRDYKIKGHLVRSA